MNESSGNGMSWRIYGRVINTDVDYTIWQGLTGSIPIFQITNGEDQRPGNSGYYRLDSLLRLKGIKHNDISIEADVSTLRM